MKKFILLLSMLFLTLTSVLADQNIPEILPSQKGIIQNLEYVDINENGSIQTKQVAEIKLLEGALKGSLIYIDNQITGNPYYDIKLKKGMKVLLHVENNGDSLNFAIEDIYRANILGLLSLLFCGLLIYVGRKKGLYSLVSILVTSILIFYALSPMILEGINPVTATLLVSIISTILTMYLVGGFNMKSTSAIVGCILSLISAGVVSFLIVKYAYLTGFTNETSLFLYSIHPELNFVAIVVSTMMLATLGAVMDVGMSISSTINEIYTIDNTKTFKELFISGMNVGKDIIGTMANTLILVYLGASLPLILLVSNIDLQKFINLNQVVTEVASALIGSSAIIICVPLTAIVTAKFILIKKNESPDFSKLQ